MPVEVTHRPETYRFEARVDNRIAWIDYALEGDVLTILHTDVPAELGGRGIAGDLTRAALDTARARRWRVVPACSYAATYFKRHPQYEDLLASGQ